MIKSALTLCGFVALLGAGLLTTGCDSLVTPRGHVVIIGVDGLSPAGIQAAPTPTMDRMCAEGSCTFEARAVLPTKSSPNWMSMVSGAAPTQHGVTSNAWQRDNVGIPPSVTGMEETFPTIFGIARQQRPEIGIGAVYEWKGFIRLIESSALDFNRAGDDADETAALAVEYIQRKGPELLFIQLDHVDRAGHDFAHGSAEYIAAVEKADGLIAQLIEAIVVAGISDTTTVIVTADHGGTGGGHGGESMDELLIPFLVSGRNIRPGHRIELPVNTWDIASTVAFLLGLEQPAAWIGRPVCGAIMDRKCQR